MYAWLTESLADDDATVITANRRLARTLVNVYSKAQQNAGLIAWRRPSIYAWTEWLAVLVDAGRPDILLPTRINAQQSRLVWEQCLREDIDDPLINIGSVARLCRETWLRLCEWQVPLAEFQNRAVGRDQRIFARAAGRYAERLRAADWIDDGLLPRELTRLLRDKHLQVTGSWTLAGFDRMTPRVQSLLDAAVEAGVTRKIITPHSAGTATLLRYDNPDDELRAAGQWARNVLQQNPDQSIAIVDSDLEQSALRSARLLREGFVPGWQYAARQYKDALNVSYGRKLGDYPAIHTALLALRWFSDDLAASDISVLLRSPFLGDVAGYGRGRLELRLRDVPDRQWSRSLLSRFFRKYVADDESDDASAFVARIADVGEALEACPARQRASDWARFIDDALQTLHWPGDSPLDSEDFQLVNRWRDLLNEFARLDLVSAPMSVGEAIQRLGTMAADTLFQAESGSPVVNVLGALEAAGTQFDRLWVTGVTANAWPASARSLALVSRELQREYGMPDSTPDDTTGFAEQVLRRLGSGANDVVFSYPALVGDAEQIPSALLHGLVREQQSPVSDPCGWHAATLMAEETKIIPDRIPAMHKDETVAGGAATINRQCTDPFSAFAFGRLGIRWLAGFQGGIPANIRGSLIHDALSYLYRNIPSQTEIRNWNVDDRSLQIAQSIDAAFGRLERYSDSVLRRLLTIERQRCDALLKRVIEIDCERDPFVVKSVENSLVAAINGASFRLRCDRVDCIDGNRLLIFDYKTGQTRKFLASGEPDDLQLVVYACALDTAVAGLALFNVDSRRTMIDGVGPAFKKDDEWEQRLSGWIARVRVAAGQIAAGDVRLNVLQKSRDAQPLSLLSRFAELRREA